MLSLPFGNITFRVRALAANILLYRQSLVQLAKQIKTLQTPDASFHEFTPKQTDYHLGIWNRKIKYTLKVVCICKYSVCSLS